MIIVLKPRISKRDERAVLDEIRKLGYKPHVMRGVERIVVGAIGDERRNHTLETLTAWRQVERVMPVQKRYKLVSREAHRDTSTIRINDHVIIGGPKFHVMAGPCSVESEKQLLTVAHAVAKACMCERTYSAATCPTNRCAANALPPGASATICGRFPHSPRPWTCRWKRVPSASAP